MLSTYCHGGGGMPSVGVLHGYDVAGVVTSLFGKRQHM